MSQPPAPYDRQYNFTDYQTANPTAPLPGQKVDQELNAVRAALNSSQVRLGEIQADDGKIRTSALNIQVIAEAVEPLLTDAPIQAIEDAGAQQIGLIVASGDAKVAELEAVLTSQNAIDALGAASAADTSADVAASSAVLANGYAGTAQGYANAALQAKNSAIVHAQVAQDAANSVTTQGYLTDAPSDGSSYGRKDGVWEVVGSGGSFLPLTGGTVTGAIDINSGGASTSSHTEYGISFTNTGTNSWFDAESLGISVNGNILTLNSNQLYFNSITSGNELFVTADGLQTVASISFNDGSIQTTAYTGGGGGGSYLPLAGGTMTGNITFDGTSGQFIGKGQFDTSRGGNYGISLVCSIGYEFNWQAGWLTTTNQGSSTPRPLYLDSLAGTTLRAWDSSTDNGVEVAHTGINVANATPYYVNVSPDLVKVFESTNELGVSIAHDSVTIQHIDTPDQTAYFTNEYIGFEDMGATPHSAWIEHDVITVQDETGMTQMRAGGITFPDATVQTTAASLPFTVLQFEGIGGGSMVLDVTPIEKCFIMQSGTKVGVLNSQYAETIYAHNFGSGSYIGVYSSAPNLVSLDIEDPSITQFYYDASDYFPKLEYLRIKGGLSTWPSIYQSPHLSEVNMENNALPSFPGGGILSTCPMLQFVYLGGNSISTVVDVIDAIISNGVDTGFLDISGGSNGQILADNSSLLYLVDELGWNVYYNEEIPPPPPPEE